MINLMMASGDNIVEEIILLYILPDRIIEKILCGGGFRVAWLFFF